MPHRSPKLICTYLKCIKLLKHPCDVIKFGRLLDGANGKEQCVISNLGQGGKVSHFDFQGAIWDLTIVLEGTTANQP